MESVTNFLTLPQIKSFRFSRSEKKSIVSYYKVRKTAKIRKRYNQVSHLSQDTTWESNKNTINITNKSQEVSTFPAGGHKAAMNRRKSMRNTRSKNTNDPQKKYRLGTVL